MKVRTPVGAAVVVFGAALVQQWCSSAGSLGAALVQQWS